MYLSREYFPSAEMTLVGSVMSLLMAGSTSVALSVTWNLLNCAQHSKTVQVRIQKEIDEIIGRERPPAWDDRKRMPYTTACLWELYRLKATDAIPRA